MKIIFSLTLALVSMSAMAQLTDKEVKKHQKKVLESLEKKKGVSSLDTLFCKGKSNALVNVLSKSFLLGAEEQTIQDVNSKKDLIIISLKNYKDQNQVVRYYNHYQFPSLKMNCDVPNEIGSLDVYETICKYQLINENGLDTMRVELFTVLKGNISPMSNDGTSTGFQNGGTAARQDINNYNVIVPRNKQSFLMFLGDNIQQDSKMIGSIVKSTVNGKEGLLTQYSVFNSVGAMICTATETKFMSHEWNLLTYKNNLFNTITSSIGKDKDDIVKFLIDYGFL
jgi:hypothetical protein